MNDFRRIGFSGKDVRRTNDMQRNLEGAQWLDYPNRHHPSLPRHAPLCLTWQDHHHVAIDPRWKVIILGFIFLGFIFASSLLYHYNLHLANMVFQREDWMDTLTSFLMLSSHPMDNSVFPAHGTAPSDFGILPLVTPPEDSLVTPRLVDNHFSLI